MLYGVGTPLILTNELSQTGTIRTEELLFPPCIASFSLDADVTEIQAKCLKGGIRQTVASAISEKEYTMTVTTEFVDWTGMQYAYDEIAQVSSAVTLPRGKATTIPAGGTFTDADLIGVASSVRAYIDSRGTWGNRIFLEPAASAGAVTANNLFHVDDVTGLVTLNSGVVGAVIQYSFNTTYTTIESIGHEQNFDAFGKIAFSGELVSTEAPSGWQLYVPEMSPITVPSLSVDGDVTSIETQYRVNIAAGQRAPFIFYDLSTAT